MPAGAPLSRPTTLYRGGTVRTPGVPAAQALLVVGDRVAWVGSDEAAAAHAASADEVVELAGALVAPAFVDAHAHVTETGLALTGIDLRAATRLPDVLARLERAARHGTGPLLGHGWDERSWPEQRPPTRAELDRAGGGRQVYLARVDVHSAVISTALAEAYGLREQAGWSDDGRIERDAHHAARALTRQGISAGERDGLQRAALAAAAAAGIGCLHEMSAPHIAPPDDLAALLTPEGAHARPDVVGYRGALARDDAERAALVAELGLPPGAALRGLAGDLCVDGSVGSRTAAMRHPYADADTCGHTYLDADQVGDHLVACTAAGLQAGFHVIGDGALDVVAAGLRAAADRVGVPALRGAGHRLEHVELADPGHIRLLADLAVVASVQPAFDAAWGGGDQMYARGSASTGRWP